MIENADTSYMAQARSRAERYLAAIEKAAKETGVSCTTRAIVDERPYDAIIRTAQEQGCDLIVMASHGRSGMKGLLLGSETQKVLTHSTIPVLVMR
jgi:nucleotide-binding universal stress UspA family protein